MKKIFLILIAASWVLASHGQFRLGIRSGLTLGNQLNPYIHIYSIKPSYDRGQSLLRMNGGFITEVNLSKQIDLRMQLAIAGLGYKLPQVHDQFGNQTSPAQEFHLSYLTLPVQILFPFDLRFGKLWVGAGLYASALIDGKIIISNSPSRIDIGNGPPAQFKPLDFGITPTAGLKLSNGLLFGIDYNLGLADVSTSADKSRNVFWSIYLGYVFKNN
jgi:hypothetical protein